ncbi:hypothetical protein AFB00_03515 [Pseudonocardia sp. HH130630-07]|nr:hypothetical protein AFB00_03515 [Pseudonocardia sp. HH130630-07]
MPSRTVVTRDTHRPVRRPIGAVGILTSALAGGGMVAGHVALGAITPQPDGLAVAAFELPTPAADPATPAVAAGAVRALAEPPPPVDVDEIVGAATGAVDDALRVRDEQVRAARAAADAARTAAEPEPDEDTSGAAGDGTGSTAGSGPSSCAAGTEGMEGVAANVATAGEKLRCMFGVDSVLGLGSRGNASDHPSGKALDFMVDRATGDRLAEYAMANQDSLGISYVIWRQRIDTGSGWETQEDRGGETANHMDHVHISFD